MVKVNGVGECLAFFCDKYLDYEFYPILVENLKKSITMGRPR